MDLSTMLKPTCMDPWDLAAERYGEKFLLTDCTDFDYGFLFPMEMVYTTDLYHMVRISTIVIDVTKILVERYKEIGVSKLEVPWGTYHISNGKHRFEYSAYITKSISSNHYDPYNHVLIPPIRPEVLSEYYDLSNMYDFSERVRNKRGKNTHLIPSKIMLDGGNDTMAYILASFAFAYAISIIRTRAKTCSSKTDITMRCGYEKRCEVYKLVGDKVINLI